MYKVDFEKPIHVYFMGIGGISMSGLAEILLQEGFTVSGSDMKESEITEILKNLGARIFIGQKAENISDDIDLVVYTAAIHADNPEFVEVKRRNIPMLTRAQLLGQIMLNYKYGVASPSVVCWMRSAAISALDTAIISFQRPVNTQTAITHSIHISVSS